MSSLRSIGSGRAAEPAKQSMAAAGSADTGSGGGFSAALSSATAAGPSGAQHSGASSEGGGGSGDAAPKDTPVAAGTHKQSGAQTRSSATQGAAKADAATAGAAGKSVQVAAVDDLAAAPPSDGQGQGAAGALTPDSATTPSLVSGSKKDSRSATPATLAPSAQSLAPNLLGAAAAAAALASPAAMANPSPAGRSAVASASAVGALPDRSSTPAAASALAAGKSAATGNAVGLASSIGNSAANPAQSGVPVPVAAQLNGSAAQIATPPAPPAPDVSPADYSEALQAGGSTPDDSSAVLVPASSANSHAQPNPASQIAQLATTPSATPDQPAGGGLAWSQSDDGQPPSLTRTGPSRNADAATAGAETVGTAAPASPSDTSAVSVAGSATRSLPDELSHQILGMVGSDGHEAVLRLHPPELGELTVRVMVEGRNVSAWFDSPQPQVQQAVSQALGQLRSDLGGAGYNLNGAWVGADASGQRQRSANAAPPAARSVSSSIGTEQLGITEPVVSSSRVSIYV